jgi:hypothetical protein
VQSQGGDLRHPVCRLVGVAAIPPSWLLRSCSSGRCRRRQATSSNRTSSHLPITKWRRLNRRVLQPSAASNFNDHLRVNSSLKQARGQGAALRPVCRDALNLHHIVVAGGIRIAIVPIDHDTMTTRGPYPSFLRRPSSRRDLQQRACAIHRPSFSSPIFVRRMPVELRVTKKSRRRVETASAPSALRSPRNAHTNPQKYLVTHWG